MTWGGERGELLSASWGHGPPAMGCPHWVCVPPILSHGRGGMLLWQRIAPKKGSRCHGNALSKEEGGGDCHGNGCPAQGCAVGRWLAVEGTRGRTRQGQEHSRSTACHPGPHMWGIPPSGSLSLLPMDPVPTLRTLLSLSTPCSWAPSLPHPCKCWGAQLRAETHPTWPWLCTPPTSNTKDSMAEATCAAPEPNATR